MQSIVKAKREQNLAEKIDVNHTRDIRIYTWGAMERKFDETVEHSFDVRKISLDSDPGSITGLDENLQQTIENTQTFASYIQNVVKKIEKKNYTSVSVFCHRGRHRSVAIAEIWLKKTYYPQAKITHLELK